MNFDEWWSALQRLATKHGEFVADVQAWGEEFAKGRTPEEAFYEEYPEHKP